LKKYKVHKIQLKSVENDVTHTHTQSTHPSTQTTNTKTTHNKELICKVNI